MNERDNGWFMLLLSASEEMRVGKLDEDRGRKRGDESGGVPGKEV